MARFHEGMHLETSPLTVPIPQKETEQLKPEDSEILEAEETEILIEKERSFLDRMSAHPRKMMLGLAFMVVTGVAIAMERFSSESQEAVAHDIVKEMNQLPAEASPSTREDSETKIDPQEPPPPDQDPPRFDPETQAQFDGFLERAKKDPINMMTSLYEWGTEPFAMDLLQHISKIEPDIIFSSVDSLVKYFSIDDLKPMIEKVLLDEPTLLLSPEIDPPIREILEKTNHPQLIKILELTRSAPEKEQMELLALMHLIDGGMTMKQAEAVVKDSRLFRQKLIEILSNPHPLAKVTAGDQLYSQSIFVLHKLNKGHDLPNEKRFETIQDLEPHELFSLLAVDRKILSEDRVGFPSTDQGVFDELLEKMTKNKLSFDDLMTQVGGYELDNFIHVAVVRGRFGELFETMDPSAQEKFVATLLEKMTQSTEVKAAAGMVAEVVNVLRQSKDASILSVMTEKLKEGYTNAKDVEKQAAFGVLSVLLNPAAGWVPEGDRDGFRIKDHSRLEIADLENAEGVIVQAYFFYPDDDGASSFMSFIKRYQDRSQWTVKHTGGVVTITSKGEGRKIQIFANEPSAGPDAKDPDRINPIFQAMQDAGVTATYVGHRGHVYHEGITIALMQQNASLFEDLQVYQSGSCGGIGNVGEVAKDHPNVHLISTSGTGTKVVNNAFSEQIENVLLNPQSTELDWQSVEDRVLRSLRGSKDAAKYRIPQEHWSVMVEASIQHAVDQHHTISQASTSSSTTERL